MQRWACDGYAARMSAKRKGRRPLDPAGAARPTGGLRLTPTEHDTLRRWAAAYDLPPPPRGDRVILRHVLEHVRRLLDARDRRR